MARAARARRGGRAAALLLALAAMAAAHQLVAHDGSMYLVVAPGRDVRLLQTATPSVPDFGSVALLACCAGPGVPFQPLVCSAHSLPSCWVTPLLLCRGSCFLCFSLFCGAT